MRRSFHIWGVIFQGKNSDALNKSLLTKGKATLEERKERVGNDNPKEKIASQVLIKSLGIISISEGPIQWVNIKRRDGENHRTYYIDYAIPDLSITSKNTLNKANSEIRIKTHRVKNFPRFGKVIDVIWRSNSSDMGLVNSLNEDVSIKKIIQKIRDIEIIAVSEGNCWIIRLVQHVTRFGKHRVHVPTVDEWKSYLKISEYLLSTNERHV